MKKSEKILSAIVLIVLGVLFIALKGSFIGLLMTLAGIGLIALGVVDCFQRLFPLAVIKIVSGVLIIVAGWAIVEAVLYILAAMLLIVGILWLYAIVKNRGACNTVWRTVLKYTEPVICIVIGILLLFQREEFIDFIFIFSGILTIVEGGILLAESFTGEE